MSQQTKTERKTAKQLLIHLFATELNFPVANIRRPNKGEFKGFWVMDLTEDEGQGIAGVDVYAAQCEARNFKIVYKGEWPAYLSDGRITHALIVFI